MHRGHARGAGIDRKLRRVSVKYADGHHRHDLHPGRGCRRCPAAARAALADFPRRSAPTCGRAGRPTGEHANADRATRRASSATKRAPRQFAKGVADCVIDLDANFLICALENESSAVRDLENWSETGESICVSAVAWAELLCGPLTSSQAARARTLVSQIEPMTSEDASFAAVSFNRTGRRPRSLADCRIAATAIRRGARLATFDRSGFNRFAEFRLQLQEL